MFYTIKKLTKNKQLFKSFMTQINKLDMFDEKNLDGTIIRLRNQFETASPHLQKYVSKYNAHKQSKISLYKVDSLANRKFNDENGTEVQYVRTNVNGEVYLCDVLFFMDLEVTFKKLLEAGLIKEDSKEDGESYKYINFADRKSKQLVSEKQAKVIIEIIGGYFSKLSDEEKRALIAA